MTANEISWSLGSCRNKSLNRFEPAVPPHIAGDPTSSFSHARSTPLAEERVPIRSLLFAQYALFSRNNISPSIFTTHFQSITSGKDKPLRVTRKCELLRETAKSIRNRLSVNHLQPRILSRIASQSRALTLGVVARRCPRTSMLSFAYARHG